jgi:hypothetical protein
MKKVQQKSVQRTGPVELGEGYLERLERLERESRERTHARKAAQVADERPAWRRWCCSDKEAPKTLRHLMAMALASGEEGSPEGFKLGGLRVLADDLDTLHLAITDERGFFDAVRISGPALDELAVRIWRLAERANAIAELSERFADAEREERAASGQSQKEVA